jgi:hypothetical protein
MRLVVGHRLHAPLCRSMKSSTQSRVDRLWQLAATSTLVVCVGLIGSTVAVLATPSWRAAFREVPTASYRLGERIDVAPTIYAGSDRTAILFADARCAGAQASREAFRAVAEAARKANARVVVVTPASPARRQMGAEYAASIGVPVAAVSPLNLETLRLRRVPAAAVVDRTGLLLAYREGPVRPTDASALIDSLGLRP